MTIESEIEDHGIAYAENNGFETRKMQYTGRRGCRDRDFYGFGHVLMVEFKRPGRSLDVHQERERARLAAKGVHIYVIDSKDDIVALLDWVRANPIKPVVARIGK